MLTILNGCISSVVFKGRAFKRASLFIIWLSSGSKTTARSYDFNKLWDAKVNSVIFYINTDT